MTAFLTQLAGLALGHDSPGAAHVILPPRFASMAASPRLPLAEWPPVEPTATEGAAAAPGQTIQSSRRETDEDINAPPVFLPESNNAPAVRRETTASHRSRANAADPLVFEFPDSVAAGAHWLRLRVDGADSLLLDRSGPAPAFDATQKITVPA